MAILNTKLTFKKYSLSTCITSPFATFFSKGRLQASRTETRLIL